MRTTPWDPGKINRNPSDPPSLPLCHPSCARKPAFSSLFVDAVTAARPARSFFDCPTRINGTREMSFLDALCYCMGEKQIMRARERDISGGKDNNEL